MTVDAVEGLLALLDLERIEVDIFRGTSGEGPRGRVFGGHVAGQALRAAQATVDAPHRVHSLHAYFLRPGRPDVPIVHQVDRIRDGRSFTTRRVVAVQHGEAIFTLDASFQAEEQGLDHGVPVPTGVPRPETLSPRHHHGRHHRPMDTREVPHPVPLDGAPPASRQVWVRTVGSLPDDADLHACVFVYLSDMGPVGAARRVHEGRGGGREGFMTASLDHAMWFHRPARADEWLLYTLETPATGGARGLARGTMHTADGRLAVVVAQEALLRPRH